MLTHLILSGGGTNLPALLGALSLFDTTNITHICGVSSGAILGLMLCLLEKSFIKKAIEKLSIKSDDVDVFRLIDDFYVYDTNIIIEFLKTTLNIKDITFQELFQKSGIDLSVYGTNLTNIGENDLFSMETTPNMSVFTAIQISIAIPFCFKPIELNGNMYVDGGLKYNYPLDRYDDIDDKKKLCIFIIPNKTNTIPKTFPEYCRSYLSFFLNDQFDKLNIENRNCIKVLISSIDVSIFSYEPHMLNDIFNHGVETAIKQVKKEYIINSNIVQ